MDVSPVFCVFNDVVLHPVNLFTESLVTLKPKEHQYERSTISVDIDIPQMDLHVDAEQISDVLDFFKHQNYTTIYGQVFSLLFFSFV